MKTISLSKGLITIVDDDDYEFLMQWPWYALKAGDRYYAGGSQCYPDGTMDHFLMHRIILRAGPGEFVDHKSRDTLDNRRENIRICTPGQNVMNANLRSDSTTGFKGVSTTQTNGRWRATIQLNGRSKHIGRFDSPTEAAIAYDLEARNHFGEFACTNKDLGLL